MRDLGLDFQPRRPGLLTVVLLLAGVLLCADAWSEDRTLLSPQEDVEARLAQAKRRADRVDAGKRDSRPENVFSAEEAKTLRQTIGLIVHAFGHHRGMHVASAYHEALTAMGAWLVIKALDDPKWFNL